MPDDAESDLRPPRTLDWNAQFLLTPSTAVQSDLTKQQKKAVDNNQQVYCFTRFGKSLFVVRCFDVVSTERVKWALSHRALPGT